MAWGHRCATVTGSVAVGIGLLAAPAGAHEAAGWPLCGYAPEPRAAIDSLIDDRWNRDPALRELFIAPTADEVTDGGVHYRDYAGPDPDGPLDERGRLYFRDTGQGGVIGVHGVMGPVGAAYRAAGAHDTLDVPITDVCATGADGGWYAHFGPEADDAEQSIYFHEERGAFVVTDAGPASELEGIHDHWEAAGWEQGSYGWPTSDTGPTADGYGRFTDFAGDDGGGASIYWSPDTGTWGVEGAIRYRWKELGAETSYLGYPISDEYAVPGGRRSDFEGGCITWEASSGEVVDAPDCPAP